jgi:hypothetical protein
MAFETYPKNGQMGSRKKFDTETYPDGWNSGHDITSKAASNYKVKPGKEAPGNTSRREYPKKGHKQNSFGTGA